MQYSRVTEVDDFSALSSAVGEDQAIDVVTIDTDFPGLNGTAGLRHLRREYPGLTIIVVASPKDRDSVLEALSAGIHGYVPKDFSAEEMETAFRQIARGRIFVPPLISDIGHPDPSLDRQGAAHPELLTERQREVIVLLVQGMSNKEIARELRIAEGTVKVHVAAAFRLLGVHNRVAAVAALQSRSQGEALRQTLLAELRGDARDTTRDRHASRVA